MCIGAHRNGNLTDDEFALLKQHHQALKDTPALWQALVHIGIMMPDPGHNWPTLELRNCDCGSTLAIEIPDES